MLFKSKKKWEILLRILQSDTESNFHPNSGENE